MRLLLRIVGTILIAFAVILVIIDGTRTLGANSLVITPLGEAWAGINPPSLEAVKSFISTRLFGAVLDPVVAGILGLPGWGVVGVPGLLLAWAGRSRRVRMFVRQDQI